jgi:hypothetical protein
MDDLGGVSSRARAFLDRHGRRARPDSPEWIRRCYWAMESDRTRVPGPADGLDRLSAFHARYGGLSFCAGRPACPNDAHKRSQGFDLGDWEPGWWHEDDDDWIANVGYLGGECGLWLSRSTGHLTLDLVPGWSAASVENLVESAALAQETYGGERGWREAVPVTPSATDGRRTGPGWGLDGALLEPLRALANEVAEASHPGERWYADDEVAVHCSDTTESGPPLRVLSLFAWYRGRGGKRRIEAVTGPLRSS